MGQKGGLRSLGQRLQGDQGNEEARGGGEERVASSGSISLHLVYHGEGTTTEVAP